MRGAKPVVERCQHDPMPLAGCGIQLFEPALVRGSGPFTQFPHRLLNFLLLICWSQKLRLRQPVENRLQQHQLEPGERDRIPLQQLANGKGILHMQGDGRYAQGRIAGLGSNVLADRLQRLQPSRRVECLRVRDAGVKRLQKARQLRQVDGFEPPIPRGGLHQREPLVRQSRANFRSCRGSATTAGLEEASATLSITTPTALDASCSRSWLRNRSGR